MSNPTLIRTQLEEMRRAGMNVKTGQIAPTYNGQSKENQDILKFWMPTWVKNAAANYHALKMATGVNWLRNSARDLPAVVVGIGPSLDLILEDTRKISYLKTAARNGVLIATDAALRPLVRRGILPHLVLNYDCRAKQKTMWEGVDTTDMVLVANSCTSPETLNFWKGPVIGYNMQMDALEFCSMTLPLIYPHLGRISAAGTVGNGALHLAQILGCDPVISIGMDLCYAPPVKAGGHPRYRCQDWTYQYGQEGGKWIPVENKTLYDAEKRAAQTHEEEIGGKKYLTDPALKFYREALLSHVGVLDIPLIDCSAGGVLQDLVDHRDFVQTVGDKFQAALAPGATAVFHAGKILPRIPQVGIDQQDTGERESAVEAVK